MCIQSTGATFAVGAVVVFALSTVMLNAESGSAGPLAQSCGAPPAATAGRRTGTSAVSGGSISCQAAACVVARRAQ